MTAERVAVVIPMKNETETVRQGFVDRVLESFPRGCRPRLFLSVSNSTPEFVELVTDIASHDDRVEVLNLGNHDPRGLAFAYGYGMQVALEDGAKEVVEMDAAAHDPEMIREFVDVLRNGGEGGGVGAVLSTRFSDGGSSKYPLQRQLISRGGTIMANLVLGLGGWVPDMTGGFNAYRREVLSDVLGAVPVEKWISVKCGPGYFVQTEMKALVLWRGHSYEMVPIVHGSNTMARPPNLPLKTVIKSFQALMILRSQRNQHVRKNAD